MYKYVVYENGKIKKWENGVNRIVDCRKFMEDNPQSSNNQVKIHQDQWEEINACFQVYYPLANAESKMMI